MGRSPRTIFPRTITLIEACRRILRAMYPDEPALADKIIRYLWELSYPDIALSKRDRISKRQRILSRKRERTLFRTLPKRQRILIRSKEKTAKEERAKIKEAREWFGGLVAREIRLRGALDPSKALDDIDPADVRVGVVDILVSELRVFHNNKPVRTYRQVCCYETDVDRCVAELRSETKRTKWTSPAGFEKFTADYKVKLNGKAPPTEEEFTKAANAKGHYRPRKDLRAALATLGPRRPGPRAKSPEK